VSAPDNCTAGITVTCANPATSSGKGKSVSFIFGINPDLEPAITVTATWNGVGGSARFVYRKVDK
jgi:hypothetical protein